MYNFYFSNPTRIYFGEEERKNLGKVVSRCGLRALIIYGGETVKKSGLYNEIVTLLKSEGVETMDFGGIVSNPGHTKINEGSNICREQNIDVLVAVGGGSVIDSAKAIALGRYYDGDCWDIITKKVKGEQALPIVTVTTISGTGSEMNNSCVISNDILKIKRGYSNELLRPVASFLDPVLTFSVNKFQTACGAADILSHILDTTYMVRDNKMQMLNDIMESILKTVLYYAPIAVNNPHNYEARANLMWASTWALNDFLKSGVKQLAACHAIEHEISAFYGITHGLGMAILMPRYIECILCDETAIYFESMAKNVFNVDRSLNAYKASVEMINKLKTFLFEDLQLPISFSELGIDGKDFAQIARNICWNGTLPGFRILTTEDVKSILLNCL